MIDYDEFAKMRGPERAEAVARGLNEALGKPTQSVGFRSDADFVRLLMDVSDNEAALRAAGFVTQALKTLDASLRSCSPASRQPHSALHGAAVSGRGTRWVYTSASVIRLRRKNQERTQELLEAFGVDKRKAEGGGGARLSLADLEQIYKTSSAA